MRKLLITVMCVTSPLAVSGQDAPHVEPADTEAYSPYKGQDFPNRVLFGDTHLHTAYSADTGLAYATLTPEDAFRFAKGEMVGSEFL